MNWKIVYQQQVLEAKEKGISRKNEKEIKKISEIERDIIGMAPTIQKSYAETLKNQTTMNDINK